MAADASDAANVDPDPLPVVRETAGRYGVDLSRYDRKSETFVREEAGLVGLRHEGRVAPESSGSRDSRNPVRGAVEIIER